MAHYNLIIKQYAPSISRHFTEMTKVIKEGNSYEFPSKDIHKTIINKLIMNDASLFKHLFLHIKNEIQKNEFDKNGYNLEQYYLNKAEKVKLKKFFEVYQQFQKEVEQDINKGVKILNIDFYMRDLRKHALEEYQEVL